MQDGGANHGLTDDPSVILIWYTLQRVRVVWLLIAYPGPYRLPKVALSAG